MNKTGKYYVLINDKSNITLNGVKNVAGFDESYVTLDMDDGRITVEGQSLKIENLSKENGEIYVTGEIRGVLFEEEKASRGVFKRLFK